jgi:hypothetical protein
VAARELIARRLMVEADHGFPVLRGFVALGAVCSQLAAMLIGMTAGTHLRQSQIGAREVLYLNSRALDNPRRSMALDALQTSVLAQERVASLAMVELRGTLFPLDDVEVWSVVIGVALHAFLPRTAVELDVSTVKSTFGLDSGADLDMACRALEGRRANCEGVTRHAFGRAFQMLVGPRQRARRDLPPTTHGRKDSEGHNTARDPKENELETPIHNAWGMRNMRSIYPAPEKNHNTLSRCRISMVDSCLNRHDAWCF